MRPSRRPLNPGQAHRQMHHRPRHPRPQRHTHPQFNAQPLPPPSPPSLPWPVGRQPSQQQGKQHPHLPVPSTPRPLSPLPGPPHHLRHLHSIAKPSTSNSTEAGHHHLAAVCPEAGCLPGGGGSVLAATEARGLRASTARTVLRRWWASGCGLGRCRCAAGCGWLHYRAQVVHVVWGSMQG